MARSCSGSTVSKTAKRREARPCWEARGGRAIFLVQSVVARSGLTTRCDRAKVMAGCTVFVDGKFAEGFGGGLC